jgi:uncharacterized membrane protein
MIEGFLFVLTLVTGFGCGLIAGVFVAFSTFVIRPSRGWSTSA